MSILKGQALVRLGARFVPCMRFNSREDILYFSCISDGQNIKSFKRQLEESDVQNSTTNPIGTAAKTKEESTTHVPTTTMMTTKSSQTVSTTRSTRTRGTRTQTSSRAPLPTNIVPSLPSDDNHCTVESYCGAGGFSRWDKPDQWWRFITPVFLHGGIFHLLSVSYLWWEYGFLAERKFGSIRTILVYFVSGIGGFMISSTLALRKPAVGSSGAVCGVMSMVLVELLIFFVREDWPELRRMILLYVLSLIVGLFPLVDNFSQLGGILFGALAFLALIPSDIMHDLEVRGRDRIWIALKLMRFLSIFLIITFYTTMLIMFYEGAKSSCPWCKYLDCIPVLDWCESY